MLASDQISQTAENQSAERAHCESRGKRCQREDECRYVINAREELRANDGSQQAVQIKIVPLEHGTQ